jgi:hypothetical protein
MAEHAARKLHQHDADLEAGADDPEMMDLDAALAEAISPVDYVLSSDEAMASALEQADGE